MEIDNKISILSYNIWFSEENRTERTISLIQTIKENNPDIICLQEVVKPVFDYLVKNLVDYPYNYPINYSYMYNCVIFSKYYISKGKEYNFENSMMGRKLVVSLLNLSLKKYDEGNIYIENYPIIVATSHFESLFKQTNKIKIDQYEKTKKILEKLSESYGPKCPIIFCADTNLLKSEEEYYLTGDEYWKDCWVMDGSNINKKYTYDCITNDNLKNRKIGYIRSRIDRIIYNDINKLKLNKFRLIKGNMDWIEPSDHYGILAEFIYY